MTLQDLRRNYTFGSLQLSELPGCPVEFFRQWWAELLALELPEWFEANAMTLSTLDPKFGVASRIVLLKVLDTGFCFFTNYNSHKGEQIAQNGAASLNFFWPCMERQVRVVGKVEKTSAETSDEYFAARPRSSQLGAVASPQSMELEPKFDLQQTVDQLDAQYAGKPVPRPEHWGGYRVIPSQVEFWQGRPSRLHDRFVYTREGDSWSVKRLAP